MGTLKVCEDDFVSACAEMVGRCAIDFNRKYDLEEELEKVKCSIHTAEQNIKVKKEEIKDLECKLAKDAKLPDNIEDDLKKLKETLTTLQKELNDKKEKETELKNKRDIIERKKSYMIKNRKFLKSVFKVVKKFCKVEKLNNVSEENQVSGENSTTTNDKTGGSECVFENQEESTNSGDNSNSSAKAPSKNDTQQRPAEEECGNLTSEKQPEIAKVDEAKKDDM